MKRTDVIAVETVYGPMEIRPEASDQAVVVARGLRVNGVQYDAVVRMFQGLQGVWTARNIFDVQIKRCSPNHKLYAVTEAARRAIMTEMSDQLRLWTEACEREASAAEACATSLTGSAPAAPAAASVGGMRCTVDGKLGWFFGLSQDDVSGVVAVVRLDGAGLMITCVSPSKVQPVMG